MMYAETHQHWNGKEMPLPNKARLVTRDINEVHHHMSQMFCPHDLWFDAGNPPIDFRHNQASLKSVTFNATDYGNPYGRVVVNIPPTEALYLVQFSLCVVFRHILISKSTLSIAFNPRNMRITIKSQSIGL